MLSEKVKKLFSEKGYIPLTEEDKEIFTNALIELNIPLNSSIAELNLSTYGPTFSGKYELYNLAWFKIYSDDLDYALEYAQDDLNLPDEYLPLDNFEAEHGFFYNLNTGEVLELELGEQLEKFLSGELKPQWKNFNDFLEWFFELDE